MVVIEELVFQVLVLLLLLFSKSLLLGSPAILFRRRPRFGLQVRDVGWSAYQRELRDVEGGQLPIGLQIPLEIEIGRTA